MRSFVLAFVVMIALYSCTSSKEATTNSNNTSAAANTVDDSKYQSARQVNNTSPQDLVIGQKQDANTPKEVKQIEKK